MSHNVKYVDCFVARARNDGAQLLTGKIIRLILALLLVSFTTYSQAAPVFIDNNGQKLNPTQWRNKWVIINYWARWCEPCREEIPQLNSFYRRHTKDTVLLGVSYDTLSPANLNLAIKDAHIAFPVLQKNPAADLGLPTIDVIPTSFIFNPQGVLVKQLSGPQTVDSLEASIRNVP